LLTVSRSFMNVANCVLWRMVIILKANKVNFFVSSLLFVFWYHLPNFLDTPRIYVVDVRWKHSITVPRDPEHRPLQLLFSVHNSIYCINIT
jgi:hypothetical protein